MVEYWKKAVVLLGLSAWTDSFDWALVMMAIALILKEIPMGTIELSWILTLPTYMMVVLALVVGPILDRFGRKMANVLGNLITGIGWIFMGAFSTLWWHIALFRLVSVAMTAFTRTSNFTMLTEEAPAEKRQTAISIAGAFQIAGPLSINAMLALSGILGITWRHITYFIGISNIIVAILVAIFIREPPVYLERMKLGKSKTGSEEKVSVKSLFGPTMWKPITVLLIIGISYSATSIITATGQYSSYFQTTILKWSPSLIGVIGIILVPVNIGLRCLAGIVSDRIGRLNTLIVFTIPALIAGQISWRIPLFLGVGETLPVIVTYVILGCIGGLVSWGAEDSGRLPLLEYVPSEVRATAEGIKESIKQLIVSLEVTAAGYLATVLAPWDAFSIFPLIASIIALTAVFTAKRMRLETKGKKVI